MKKEKIDTEQQKIQDSLQKFILFLINHSIELYNEIVPAEELKQPLVNQMHVRKFKLLNNNLFLHQSMMKIDKTYLKNKKYDIAKCKNEIAQMRELVGHLTANVKNNNEITQIFTDFESLSNYMLLAGLSQSDILDVINVTVFVNLYLPAFIEINDEKEYKYKYEKAKYKLERKLKKAQRKNNIEQIISLTRKLTGLEKIKTVHSCCNTVMKHYFKKDNSYQYEDVEILMKAFSSLNINSEIRKKIRRALVKPLKDANKKSDIKDISFNNGEYKKNLITDQDYKKLRKELNSYFDFYNVKPLKELNGEEIERCIEILIKLDEENRIHQFLYTINQGKEFTKPNNPISYYVSIYNKLKYYEEKLNISNNLNNINEYLQKLFICDDSEYEFYKELIEEELNKIVKLIPNTYEYEIETVKRKIFK